MAGILDEVKTIIIVMMENRSFDHMLGHVSLENPASTIEGLRTDRLNNGDYANDYLSMLYPLYQLPNDVQLDADLPHEWDAVATQMKQDGPSGNFTMDGFVEAYANAGNTPNPQCIPMGYFPSGLVPVTHFLSQSFCTCDHWYSPLPASTQPNRTMALCGDTEIFTTHLQLIPSKNNLFDWMKDKARWRVYHDGFSFYTLYDGLWGHVLGPGFRRFSQFYTDMLADSKDDDPEVIIVEPCYEDAPHFGTQQPNDNHAPLAVGFGEHFLRQVYLGATANPKRWANTVMILCYDEHGGFYDHVSPPILPYRTTSEPHHDFVSLGPRVPGIIISPLVAPGSVFPQVLDHTSILQFLAEKYSPGEVYPGSVDDRRSKGIKSITAALSSQPPRPIPQPPAEGLSVQATLGKDPLAKSPGKMELAFTNAAEQLLQREPVKAALKYPELAAWKDQRDRIKNPTVVLAG